jgi:D-alanyl-D-alanine carboxypeptidase (penicillin-binding protein 5/6)
MINFSALNSQISAPKTHSQVALVYDCDHEIVLFSKKGEQKIHPASTTKIATLLYSLHCNRDPKELVVVLPELLRSISKEQKIAGNYTVLPYLLEPDAYTIGLVPHSYYSLEDLYHALTLVSANDAANVLAYHLGEQSIEQFMIGLNRFLTSLGCTETTYVNPSGLEYPAHRTTALDLAKMLSYGIKQPDFLKIIGTVFYKMETGDLIDRELNNSNRLLRSENGLQYKYCLGGKTGYTENAGYCFVGAAQNKERTVVVAVMQSATPLERFIDATNLFNAAFAEKKTTRVFYNALDPCFSVQPIYAKHTLPLYLLEDLKVESFASIVNAIEVKVEYFEAKLPIKKGEILGQVQLIVPSGKILDTKVLVASRDAPHTWVSFWVEKRFKALFFVILLVSVGIIFKRTTRQEIGA